MHVLFAPDWREGVPYQQLLAEALQGYGVRVDFLQTYKRVFPLTRLIASTSIDIFHLHWPEAYFAPTQDGWDWFRNLRFPLDLALSCRRCALVATAHNLVPHNRGDKLSCRLNMATAFHESQAVIAHSGAAKDRLREAYRLPEGRIHVIPHGDLGVAYDRPISKEEARAELGYCAGKLLLMFGTVEPYKGIEEALDWWRTADCGATLVIVGRPQNPEYALRIRQLATGIENVVCSPGWLTDKDLHLWLSAADAVLFNYRKIFTSGAANLTRSLGIPMLIPERLDTLDLGEPSPYVRRFSGFDVDFRSQLEAAVGLERCFEDAAAWRETCEWDRVARATVECYESALAWKGKKGTEPVFMRRDVRSFKPTASAS